MRSLMLCAVGVLAAVPLFAELELGTPFADHAVLQRGRKVPVWGRAKAGEKVTVSFAGQTVETTAGADGAWRADLAPLTASKTGRDLVVTSPSSQPQVVRDVLVGEVWFASGQSNMDCRLWGGNPRYRDANGALSIEIANLPYVRWFKNATVASVTPLPIKAKWHRAVAVELRRDAISAVAFYYARDLYCALDIPIGIVDASWGGTNIDAWTPRSGYADCDESIRAMADYPVKEQKDWKAETDKVGPVTAFVRQPTVIYNGLVAAWAPMAIRGFIWYQGCSNNGESALYRAKLHALYNGWSREFQNPDLKLYLVQLAPYTHNWNGIVACQNQFVAEQKNAAIAVTADLGNFHDIHPNRKEIVARRLAVHALKRDYGLEIPEDDSPTLRSVVYAGDTAELTFDHAKRLYIYADNWSFEPAFELAGTNGVWAAARVVNLEEKLRDGKMKPTGYIGTNNVIRLRSEKVPAPVHVRYMARPKTAGTVYNEVSLPLGLFER